MPWGVVAAAQCPLHVAAPPATWLTLAWPGALSSCLASLPGLSVINAWGPTRTSLMAYVLPIIGLTLGIALLGERPDSRVVRGSMRVVAGILVTGPGARSPRARRG